MKKEEQAKIGLVLVEGMLGNPNNTIERTIESFAHPSLTYLPLFRAWAPLLTKCVFPYYNPFGRTVVQDAAKIAAALPKTTPIIIMHHAKDFQTPINDARRMYDDLQEAGHRETYLLEIKNNWAAHFDILESIEERERKNFLQVLRGVYKKHNFPTEGITKYIQSINNDTDMLDATDEMIADLLQPSVATVKAKIENSERKKRWIRNIIDATTIGAAAWYVYTKYRKHAAS